MFEFDKTKILKYESIHKGLSSPVLEDKKDRRLLCCACKVKIDKKGVTYNKKCYNKKFKFYYMHKGPLYGRDIILMFCDDHFNLNKIYLYYSYDNNCRNVLTQKQKEKLIKLSSKDVDNIIKNNKKLLIEQKLSRQIKPLKKSIEKLIKYGYDEKFIIGECQRIYNEAIVKEIIK